MNPDVARELIKNNIFEGFVDPRTHVHTCVKLSCTFKSILRIRKV